MPVENIRLVHAGSSLFPVLLHAGTLPLGTYVEKHVTLILLLRYSISMYLAIARPFIHSALSIVLDDHSQPLHS